MRPFVPSLAAVLTVAACLPLTAQTVSLHGVFVHPNGTVRVRYSKDFATCAHMKNAAGQLVHSINMFCTSGNEVVVSPNVNDFNGLFAVGTQVRLCHGNNGSICSQFVTIQAATLTASPATISVSAGGQQDFTLAAGAAAAGLPYLLAGSLSGTVPGFAVGGFTVPLNPDDYFTYTLSFPNVFPLSNSSGLLDASGAASASLTLPGGLPPSLAGLIAEHAYAVVGPGGLVHVSNPERLRLVP